MKNWFVYSILALVCWGMWAFFPKIAVSYIHPRTAFVYEVLGGLLVGVAALVILDVDLGANVKGIVPSMLTGVAGYLGLFFFLYAVRAGSVTVTSAFTALYPVITIILAMVFLKEKIAPIQWLGVGLAIVSVALISYE